MTTLEFLQSVLPDDGVYYLVAFLADNPKAKWHRPYTDLATMARDVERMDRDPRFSAVYHACSAYQSTYVEIERDGKTKKAYRTDQNWLSAKSLWIDLDVGADKHLAGVGYNSKRSAVDSIAGLCRTLGLVAPTIVDSGNGIHAYWPFTEAVDHQRWVRIARDFKAVLAHAGVLADPTRTADFASILRPPGSINRKKGEKPVTLKRLGQPSDPDAIAALLAAYIEENDVEPPRLARFSSDLNSELTAHLPQYPQVSAFGEEVAKHCLQMQALRDTQGSAPYDTWRMLIGVLKHCDDGETLVPAWSERREEHGHTNTDWQTRWETWNAGPSTCVAIEQTNAAGCDGCPHRGKVTTPLQLGRVIPINQAPTVETVKTEDNMVVEAPVPPKPDGFLWKDGLMIRMMPPKEEGGAPVPAAFCQTHFYPFSRIVAEDGSNRFGVRVHLPDARVKDFDVPYEHLAAPTDLLKTLGKFGEIMTTNHKDAATHMTAYIKESLERLKREVDQVNTMTNFGWKQGYTQFLIGDRLYQNDGTVRKVILGGYAQSKAEPFKHVKGTAKGYGDAIDWIYNRPGLEPMQYVLASGWGSVLTPFGDDLYRGLVVSLYSGQSGTGKSTVCYNSMYAFGEATSMSLKSDKGFTELALWARIGTYNNLPLLLDEMTKVPADTLSRVTYHISLGEERERLKSGTGGMRFAESATWATPVFMTANTDLHALLASNLANSEAEGVRVVQLHMDEYNLPIYQGQELVDFQQACDRIRQNAGSAGHAIISYCVQNAAALKQRVRDRMARLLTHIPETKFRFYRSHAACTLVMAEVTKELGIHSFDVGALERFAIQLMEGLRQTISQTTVATPEDAYASLIADMMARIVVTYEYRDIRANVNGPENPLRTVVGTPVGRYVVGNKSEEELAGRLWLSYKDVRSWCMENRVDMPHILKYLTDRGALIAERDKATLTKGTTLPVIQTQCLEIDTTKLDGAVGGTLEAARPQARSGRAKAV